MARPRSRPSAVLTVRLPATQADAFRRLADDLDRPYGSLLADAVRRVLAEHGVPDDGQR